MKTLQSRIAVMLLAFTVIFYGCEATRNANNKQKGAVIGAAGGAVLGGIIGNNVGDGDTALGAVIGAVVGGAAGGYIGSRMDKQAQEIENEIPGAEVERVGEAINVTFDENSGVHFPTNKATLDTESRNTLDKLATIMERYPKTNVLVEGHTDSSGPDDYNMQLSKRRAMSVSEYLQGHGVAKDRMTVAYYGETEPSHTNETAQGRAKNRRVEIAIFASEELREEAKRNTQ